VTDIRVKILLIGGMSRSGSTLLGRVLGESASAICVGETRYLWARGLLNNVECGCGERFLACPFWSAVGDTAFGGWDQVDAERLAEIDRVVTLPRSLPAHWARRLRPRVGAMIKTYAEHFEPLYLAIKKVSGAKVVVDQSRDPAIALLLTTEIPALDTRIVHLIRDSRAVAHSWTQPQRLPIPIGRQEFMDQYSSLRTAAEWWFATGTYFAAMSRKPYYVKLRYEDLVARPRAALQNLSDFTGEDLVLPDSHLHDGKVMLGGHHIFSGNPMRTTGGWVPLRLDVRWQREMTNTDFATVTAITLPLLAACGYPIIPDARRRNRSSGGVS
jgi:hypothetical protein